MFVVSKWHFVLLRGRCGSFNFVVLKDTKQIENKLKNRRYEYDRQKEITL